MGSNPTRVAKSTPTQTAPGGSPNRPPTSRRCGGRTAPVPDEAPCWHDQTTWTKASHGRPPCAGTIAGAVRNRQRRTARAGNSLIDSIRRPGKCSRLASSAPRAESGALPSSIRLAVTRANPVAASEAVFGEPPFAGIPEHGWGPARGMTRRARGGPGPRLDPPPHRQRR